MKKAKNNFWDKANKVVALAAAQSSVNNASRRQLRTNSIVDVEDPSEQLDDNMDWLRLISRNLFMVPVVGYAGYSSVEYLNKNWKTMHITPQVIRDYITLDNVRRGTEFIKTVSTAIPRKEDSLLDCFNRTVTLLNDMANFVENDAEVVEDYVAKHNLVPFSSMQIIPLMLSTHLSHLCKIQEILKIDDLNIFYCLTFNDSPSEKIYFVAEVYSMPYIEDLPGKRNNTVPMSGHWEIDQDRVYVTKTFDLKNIQTKFWDNYPDGIYLSRGKEKKESGLSIEKGLCVETLAPIDNIPYYGKWNDEIEKHYNKLLSFREKGIQRNYLLVGPSGSGKSSWCILFARRHTNRVIKISNDAFYNLSKVDLDLVFDLFGPQFIIADDFDRSTCDNPQTMLYFLESMKDDHKNVSILATANNIRTMDVAMLRPGRFDEIMFFGAPEEAERKIIIQGYINKFGLKVSKKDIEKLVAISDKYTHAYIKEFVMHIMHDDISSLVERINMLKEIFSNGDYLNVFNKEGDPDNEDSDSEDY